MIIVLFPFKFHVFGPKVFANLIVDIGFVGLTELVAPLNAVHLAFLDEMSARLVEPERNVF